MRWGQALRRIELWAKRAFLARRDRLTLCPFDSFIYPTAPWVCMVCHKLRKKLKGEKYGKLAVFTGGWAILVPGEYPTSRSGGFFAERWGHKPIPVGQFVFHEDITLWNRDSFIPQAVALFMQYEAPRIAIPWGLPRDTVLEVDILASDRHGYVRIDVNHPDGTKIERITLFIP